MSRAIPRLLISKAYAALLAVVLCCSILGIQSFGYSHSVVHAQQEQDYQFSSVFDSVELALGGSPEKSNPVCKLLDSLLLGTSVVAESLEVFLLSFNHISLPAVILTGQAIWQIWSYYSQAPPLPYLSR